MLIRVFVPFLLLLLCSYRIATAAAKEALEASAVNHGDNLESLKKDLLNMAKTTLSSKVVSQDKEHFAKLCVDAVLRLKGSVNLDLIQIIKKPGGRMEDSYLDDGSPFSPPPFFHFFCHGGSGCFNNRHFLIPPGFILPKKIGTNQPKRMENAKILIANTAMDTDKIKIFGARVTVESTAGLAEIERAEKVDNLSCFHGRNCKKSRAFVSSTFHCYFFRTR